MPIKAVILDVSGTLIHNTNGERLVPGVSTMVSSLGTSNIKVFLASNRRATALQAALLLGVDTRFLLDSGTIGRNKGSGKFVSAVCKQLGAAPNEVLYLGDDQYDFFEAINSGVLFFLADWASPKIDYGINVAKPQDFASILETFFLKEALWYYAVDGIDARGREVLVRALVGPDEAKGSGVTALLKSKGLKPGSPIAGYQLADYLTLHLLSSIYLEGLHMRGPDSQPLWCLYPGHDGAQIGPLEDFAAIAARLFKDRFQGSLITRHTRAPSAKELRERGLPVTLDIQLRTICLDPALRGKVAGKYVLVVDDFTTDGFGFEAARNYLLNAGASGVACIAVGKYRHARETTASAFSPLAGVSWDSFMAQPTLTSASFASIQVPAEFHVEALNQFASSTPSASPTQSDTSDSPLSKRPAPHVHNQRSQGPQSYSATASIRAGSAPVLARAQQDWKRVQLTCREVSISLGVLLTHTRPISSRENQVGLPILIIEADHQFHANALSEKQRRTMLEAAIAEVLGTQVSVRIVLRQPDKD